MFGLLGQASPKRGRVDFLDSVYLSDCQSLITSQIMNIRLIYNIDSNGPKPVGAIYAESKIVYFEFR